MKKILLATSNVSKVKEFKEILKVIGVEVEIITPLYFNDTSEPLENGSSYAENSYIKAKYFYDKYHLPTLADDSGIEIDFYNGGPGIYSARFLKDLSYKEKNEYITKQMQETNDRGAKFKCYITYINNDEVKVYEGIVNGKIASSPMGQEGFGYDPIFIPEGETLSNALLGQDYKNKYCHRALALQKWAKEYCQ